MSGTEVADGNIHTVEDFHRAYGGREWTFYRGVVVACVYHGEPGPILDLGAGLGLFVEACNRYGLRCIGLEGSEYAVEAARKRYPMEIHHHYLSQRLPFEDDSFSVVVCNQTIEHVSHDTAAFLLEESHRVLRKGGAIIINSPCYYDGVQRKERTHVNLYTPSTLRRAVGAAGFSRYVATDSPKPILGKNRIPFGMARLVFRFVPADLLSATANCVAYKS